MRAIATFLLLCAGPVLGQENLNDVPADLVVPAVSHLPPSAGHRVRATTQGWENTQVHHALYLPKDWNPGRKLPVLVEYPGNGGYTNPLGDTSDGTVESCVMGYGLSAGHGFLWICLPFIDDGQNATRWWGDVEETKRYCVSTVKDVCARLGGDDQRVILLGFSRGAIACNYIGLHDDSIAKLWSGMVCHSHYEGEFKHPAPDQAAWPERLRRLGSRPQWISQELSTQRTQHAIVSAGVAGDFTFVTLPYPNHSARWLLCNLPIRLQAREWLARFVDDRR